MHVALALFFLHPPSICCTTLLSSPTQLLGTYALEQLYDCRILSTRSTDNASVTHTRALCASSTYNSDHNHAFKNAAHLSAE